MRRFVRPMCISLLTCMLAGCAGSSDPGTAETGASASVPVQSDGLKPEAVVFQFLESVRVGDDEKASQMLTPLARERTEKAQLVVAPPGSPTASFKVGEVETVAEDCAHVQSEWTDVDDTGQPQSSAILWILRNEPAGWRIAGMGTVLFEGEPPLFLNFENPEDMLRKQELAEREFRRREQLQKQGQGHKTEDPVTATKPAKAPPEVNPIR